MGETDLISRQEAIGYLMTNMIWYDEYGYEFDDDDYKRECITELINGVPSAQQWIPCSERLPEDFEEVNVTWINTDPEPYYDFVKGKPFTGTAVFYKGRWFWYSAVCTDYLREYGFSPNDLMDDSIKVVAWQQIPEPYKGEQECTKKI